MSGRRRRLVLLSGLLAAALGGCDHAAVAPPVRPAALVEPLPIASLPPLTSRMPTVEPALPLDQTARLSPQPPPTACLRVPDAIAETPGARRISVTGRPRQTITGWGASVVTDTYVDPLVVPGGLSAKQLADVDRWVFDEAGIDIVRVFGPGYSSAPFSASAQSRSAEPAFAFMRRAKRFGVRFMFTGAGAPPRLMSGRKLRDGAEEAYAEWVADYLETAREAGTPFSFAALANEPENEASRLQMSADQSAVAYSALAAEVRRRSLDVELILGDTTGWGSACPYAIEQTASPSIRYAAKAIATHPYFGTTGEARSLSQQARLSGLELWQTEFGTGCAECPDEGGIHEAILWSQEIARGLGAARTSAWFAFRAVADATHGPGDSLLVRDRKSRETPVYASKRFHVFRQYSAFGTPGSRVIEVDEQVPGVTAVAFRRDGSTAVVVTNTDENASRQVELDLGGRPGTIEARRTSGSESFAPQATRRYGGAPLQVELPPDTVTTFLYTPS